MKNGKTTPKHGKALENRLWSKLRRGDGSKQSRDGGINPDGSIAVAAVCGAEVRVYDTVKHGRARLLTRAFVHHGAARLYAHEHDESARQGR